MLKAGLIVGGVTFLGAVALGAGISPFCVPCLALVAGVAAGYLAGMFDKLPASNSAVRAGAGAGAVGGGGALAGHMVAGVINAFAIGPDRMQELLRSFGVRGNMSPTTYYVSVFGGGCCLGLFEVALMAGLGALGGMLWYQMVGKNASTGAPPAPAM